MRLRLYFYLRVLHERGLHVGPCASRLLWPGIVFWPGWELFLRAKGWIRHVRHDLLQRDWWLMQSGLLSFLRSGTRRLQRLAS